MRNYSGIILAFLVIAVIFTAGCTNQTAPEVPVPVPPLTTPVPTLTNLPVISTPAIPILPSTVATTPAVLITTAVVPITTQIPKADPTDVSEITFSFYYNSDFSVEYPSTWTIETSMYTPYQSARFIYTTIRVLIHRIVSSRLQARILPKNSSHSRRILNKPERSVSNPLLNGARKCFREITRTYPQRTIWGTTNIFRAGTRWHHPMMSRYPKGHITTHRHTP